MKTGILLCGHGSRDPETAREFERLAAGVGTCLPDSDVTIGYLELATPTISDSLATLVTRGAERILILPTMLLEANHLTNDVPLLVERFATAHPQIELRLGPGLSRENRLLEAAAARIAEAEKSTQQAVPRAESVLLMVARGSSNADANARIDAMARELAAQLGFGHVITAFSGAAAPSAETGLEQALASGARRIVVLPYLLLTGVLVKRLAALCDAAALAHPTVDILRTVHLGDHPLVLDCLAAQARDLDAAIARKTVP